MEYYANSLAQALIRRPWPNARLTVYLPPYPPPELTNSRFAKIRVRPWVSTRFRWLWLALMSWIDRLDVLYTFADDLPWFSRGMRVITIYDTIFCEYPETYSPGRGEELRVHYSARAHQAGAVAVCSQATARNVRKFLSPGARTIVLGGAPRSCFTPASQPAELPVVPGLKTPYFLFTGRMDKRKNPAQVVRAYRLLLRRGFQADLVLVGPPDSGSDELQAVMAEPPVAGEQIYLPGYLSEQALVKLYQGAAGFIYPSLAEGYGLPILEAAACGVPVISSRIPAVEEVASDFALLVDPQNPEEIAEAMVILLSDNSRSEAMRKLGLKTVQNLSWDQCAENFMNGILAVGAERRILGAPGQ